MKNIVFDLDDTLWNLNKHACELTGINYEKLTTFYASENNLLTNEEKIKLLNIYQNPILWKDITLIDKAKDIHLLECLADDIKVYIISNCMNDRVKDYKRSFLSNIFNLPEDQIILNVTQEPKKVLEDTYIFIDDSPYNVMQSKAKYTVIPNKPWNQNIKNPNTNLFRFNNFNSILQFIILIIIGNQ